MNRVRCAISGIGHRSRTWISEMAKAYSDVAEIIALCDPVPGRCHDMCAAFGLSAEEYSDYDAMLAAAEKALSFSRAGAGWETFGNCAGRI